MKNMSIIEYILSLAGEMGGPRISLGDPQFVKEITPNPPPPQSY